jgi:hypothetical protein
VRTHNNRRIILPSFLIPIAALAGLTVSVLALADITLPCQTSGCGLYAGITVAGLSPYVLGASGFAAILLCWTFFRNNPGSQFLFRWLLMAGVLISSAFLFYQILYWPCTTCLIVAAAMGLTAAAARSTIPTCRTKVMSAILMLWLVLFIPAMVAAAKEAILIPTPLYGSAQAPVKIFFSPTCPACQRVVSEALGNPSLKDNLALIPIAKDREDLNRFAHHFTFETEVEELFRPLETNPPPMGMRQRWQLARNQMVLASMGATSVPVVIAPRLITPAPASPASSPAPGSSFEEVYKSLFPDQYQAPNQNNVYDQGCDMQATTESSCES